MKQSIALAALLALLPSPAARAEDFVLAEHLGHAWSNELVTFPLSPEQREAASAGRALLAEDGTPVPYQLLSAGSGTARIAFQADLPPLARRAYRLADGTRADRTDLVIEETGETIRVTTSHIGLSVRQRLEPGQGPVEGLRLRSGAWTGGSTFSGTPEVTEYRAALAARGPVFADIVCAATFADGGTWQARFRLLCNEPVIVVDERFDAPGGGTFSIALGGRDYLPTHLYYRSGEGGSLGSVDAWKLPARGTVHVLEPWVHWWSSPRQGNWFALYTPTPVPGPATASGAEASLEDDSLGGLADDLLAPAAPPDPYPDMLMIGVVKPSLWRDPDWSGKARQPGIATRAAAVDGVVTVPFPLGGGRRRWMLATPEKAPSVAVLAQRQRKISPRPQRYLVRHGIFPLDEVKDYVLSWEGDHENYPRLFLQRETLPELKAWLATDPPGFKPLVRGRPVDRYYLDAPIRTFLATDEPGLGRLLAAKGVEFLQSCVDSYLVQDGLGAINIGPHMQTMINTALNTLDPMLGTEYVSPALRRKLLAQIAFLGYVVESPDYWSPRRGFSANPNMTTTVATYQTVIACMIPSHPKAAEWAELGLRELRDNELMRWSDSDGGWLEAPHYAMVSYDHILGAFIAARNAGFADYVFEERMRKVLDWFASISTPPDSRTGGFRHLPAIGNTYIGERTGIFGIAAGIWRERDPQFAAQMQWMHAQQGHFGPSGIGGFCPTMSGYRGLMTALDLPLEPYPLQSRWFRKTGVVLRSGAGSGRETYLYLVAGSNHAHYDYDSGSIVLWGKGRLLANDFGYIGRHADRWHSMLTGAGAGGGGTMQVLAFAPSAALDTVLARKGAWTRQIALAKDPDPLGPTFFLLRDSYTGGGPATWRLWCTTQRPDAEPSADQAAELAAQRDAAIASGRGLDAVGGDDDELLALDIDADKPRPPPPTPDHGIVLHAAGATVIGEEDVDMDVFFYEPGALALATEQTTQQLACGHRNGVTGPMATTQSAIVGRLAGNGAVVALLYPRLKTEAPPTVTWLAAGRGAQVVTAAGTDYVFLAPESFERQGRGCTFSGTAGAARIRGRQTTLTLGAAGSLRAGGEHLEAEGPATR